VECRHALAVTLGYVGAPLWWELTTLLTVILLGHWIQMRSILRACGALRELDTLLPLAGHCESSANRIEDVPVSSLERGRLGARGPSVPLIASRGVARVTSTSRWSRANQHRSKKIGAKVIAETVNATVSLRLEVTHVGQRTALARIMRLVEQAQASPLAPRMHSPTARCSC
jgi:P-type Cu2+ transporter